MLVAARTPRGKRGAQPNERRRASRGGLRAGAPVAFVLLPLWTYVVVHAHGKLVPQQASEWLARHLDELTRANEAHRREPWQVSDAPSASSPP